MLEILVVSTDVVDRLGILQVLDAAGYHVSGASTFDEAKRLLTEMSPDLVIADQRLGAYNGLHVLLRARSENPHVSAIVSTAVREGGLEADARRLNVECVVKPQDPAEWLAFVSRTLHIDRAGGSSSAHADERIHAISN
jgi:DNA-binding response OmpR family regulator